MTDSIALWVIHVGGSAIVVLAIAAFVLWATLTLTWKIYQRLFEWEHLVRTVRHCYRRTWLKPPEKLMRPRKRDADGEWVYYGNDDD